MFLKLKHTVAAAVLAAPFLASAPASSSTLIVGTPTTTGNFIPFGSIAGFPEYQQVYAASNFPGTLAIDDIEFFTVPNSGTGTPNTGTITISLSTTSAPVNGLSTTLSANIGPNNTVVFNSALPAIQNGVLDIPFSTPFTYNPANGNLLVDIVEASPFTGGPSFQFNSPSGGVFSRGFSGQTIPVANDSGLVTGFSSAVPEPSTWAMMLLGFAGLGFVFHRSRRKPSFA